MQKLILKSNNIKNYMIILILIFIVSSILTNIFFYKDIHNISIDSELYHKIRDSQALKADILPPKLYIVESYLLIQQIVNEKDDSKVKVLIEEMEKTRQEYYTYYKYWGEIVQQDDILYLLNYSNQFVTEFYEIYDNEFIPFLQSDNHQASQQIVNSDLKRLFELHRNSINSMSEKIEATNLRIENDAKEYAKESQVLLLSVYIISIFIILGLSLLIFKKVTAIEKNMIISQYDTESANERLESMIEGLKKFKHSYDNTLASIDGYVMNDDFSGLRTYLDEIIGEKNKNEMTNYFKLNFIKNSAITGLIISKMIYSEKLGVDFKLKVRSEVSGIGIKPSHLCGIIGVLLDNAIEAAYDSKDKKVVFKIDESQDSFIFEVNNSIKYLPDRTKMFEKGWTTKGQNRGFGLWMAKDIISKYDNVVLNSSIDDSSVVQELFVLKNTPEAQTTIFTDIL